jgi:aryl-alcohol dehydrogenase-like predicted oxidoreductase
MFSNHQIKELLKRIEDNDNYFLDTAQNYGNAESLVGDYSPGRLNDKIVTKIQFEKSDSSSDIMRKIKASLFKVKQDRFYSVLLHNSEIIHHNNFENIISGLADSKDLGLTLNIGVSCYESIEVTSVMERTNLCTQFQIPENVADRRNQHNLELITLHKSGISFAIRSIFLQGILLLNRTDVPNYFHPCIDVFDSIAQSSKFHQVTRLKYCLDYVNSLTWKDGIVLGIEDLNQLDEISKELNKPILVSKFDSKTFNSNYVDPRSWVKLR